MAGDHDRGSAKHEHSPSNVEDRGTDATGGGQDKAIESAKSREEPVYPTEEES